MEHLFDQRQLLTVLRNSFITGISMWIIWLVLFEVDSSLTQPIWLYIFEMSKEKALWLSRGVAAIYLILAHCTSRSLDRENWWHFAALIIIFLGLNVFAFLGQAAALELAVPPWPDDEDDVVVNESSIAQYSHIIATGLTVFLFAAAVAVDYFIAGAGKVAQDLKKVLALASLSRWFQFRITIVKGKYERAKKSVRTIAENMVFRRMLVLEDKIFECKQLERQLLSEQHYQLQILEEMKKQRIEILKAVYAAKKTSFFKNLFS